MLHDLHAAKREKVELCETCRFFFSTPNGGHGDCRRFPPTGAHEGHPTTNPQGYCGEYKADQHKIDALKPVKDEAKK